MKTSAGFKAGNSHEKLYPTAPLKCLQSLPLAMTEPGGSVHRVGLGGGKKLAIPTPILLPLPFSPTASINLCQLLPPAKPCLRETDLKGSAQMNRAAPLWGYSATTLRGQRPQLQQLGSETTRVRVLDLYSQGRSTIHNFSNKRHKLKENKNNFNTEFIFKL